MVLWYTLVTLRTGKGTDVFTENTVWKAVERLINANADIFTILIRFLLRDDRNGRPVSKQILFHSASRYYCTMVYYTYT